MSDHHFGSARKSWGMEYEWFGWAVEPFLYLLSATAEMCSCSWLQWRGKELSASAIDYSTGETVSLLLLYHTCSCWLLVSMSHAASCWPLRCYWLGRLYAITYELLFAFVVAMHICYMRLFCPITYNMNVV